MSIKRIGQSDTIQMNEVYGIKKSREEHGCEINDSHLNLLQSKSFKYLMKVENETAKKKAGMSHAQSFM